jgi:hypothetical protein
MKPNFRFWKGYVIGGREKNQILDLVNMALARIA